jgi:hypothetical protein
MNQNELLENALPETTQSSVDLKVLYDFVEYLKQENTSLKQTLQEQEKQLSLQKQENQELNSQFLKRLEIQESYKTKFDEFVSSNEEQMGKILFYVQHIQEELLEESHKIRSNIINMEKGLRTLIEGGVVDIDKELARLGLNFTEMRKMSDEKFTELLRDVNWGFGEYRIETVIAYAKEAKSRLVDIEQIVEKSSEILQRLDPNKRKYTGGYRPDLDPDSLEARENPYIEARKF